MTNPKALKSATDQSASRERLAATGGWQIAVVVLLAAGLAPTLVNAVSMGASWISEGGQYVEDVPGLAISTVLKAVPFVALAVCALRTRCLSALISLTVASVIVVATNAYGYWLVFFPGEDSSSTDALIFVVIVPLQWVVAAVAGVIVLVQRRRRPALRLSV